MKRFLQVLVLLSCHGGLVLASPTSNEFLPCHRMAAALLQKCLDDREGECWDRSKRVHDHCHAEVYASHRPNKAKIEAQRKAEMEARERFRRAHKE